ncbi:MAG: citrate/2-methylcitrate synthase [Actinomycetota bacterium]
MSEREGFSPGLEGVIATDTQVSFLDLNTEQIIVRGYDLIELARTVAYPDIAYLLLHEDLPTAEQRTAFDLELRDDAALPPGMEALFRALPPGMDAMDTLRTGLSALSGFEDPRVLADTSHEANLAKATRILARAPAVAVNGYRATNSLELVQPDPELGFVANFLHMIPGPAADEDAVAVFDRVLTCYSEHELANSSLTARVVASTLADIYGAIVAATASLKGPLHGGANEAAAVMFSEITSQGGSSVAEAYVLDKLARQQRIMGFGHRVYMHRPDPRAVLLIEDLERLRNRRPDAADLLRSYEICAATMEREKGLYPNADLPIGLLMYLLDIPIDLFTPIFLCARTAGLVAHVIEQHDHNRLYRPRVLYDGPRDKHPTDPSA